MFKRTGPNVFDAAFYHYLVSDDKSSHDMVIALPPTFFFPLSFNAVPRGVCALRDEQVRSCIRPETFAIHYWSASWKQ